MRKGHDNSITELARRLSQQSGKRVTLTGSSTPIGTDRETRNDRVPLPIGDEGDVLTVVDDSGELVMSWEASTGGGSSIVVQEGDVTVVALVDTLDFDASDFNVAETPTGEANISLAYGSIAGTPAEGNHTHSYYAPGGTDVAIADGGTGQSTAQLAFDALDPLTTKGDIIGNNGTHSDRLAVGATNGMMLVVDAAASMGIKWASWTYPVNFLIDGGGSVITTGVKGYLIVDRDSTIIAGTLLSTVSGSISVTIKKATYSSFPTLSSIVASAPLVLSAAQKSRNTTLTGWTTAVSAGDILEISVTSVTSCSQVLVDLTMTSP